MKDNIDKVNGFLSSHGHEDHIGAIPYVLKEVNAPIYATKLTNGIIEHKLKEHNMLTKVKRKVVNTDSISTLDVSVWNLSRQTTVFRMLQHLLFIHRQELLCIPETLK